MNKLSELKKDIIFDQLLRLADNYDKNELNYAIYILKRLKQKRKRQNKEIKEN